MKKLIKLLNKNIIIITLVGTFVIDKTPVDIFKEVESDISSGINMESSISNGKSFD